MSKPSPTFISSIERAGKRPKKLIIPMIDNSGSMAVDGKMEAANNAMSAAATAVKDLQSVNQETDISIRRLKFSSIAEWVDAQATNVATFTSTNLEADGGTATDEAVRLCVSYLQSQSGTGSRNAGLILISDGQPNSPSDYEQAIQEALEIEAFEKADRIAIAIGSDADEDSLRKFASPQFPVLHASNAEQLVQYLKMASVILATGGDALEIERSISSVDVANPNPAVCESIIW